MKKNVAGMTLLDKKKQVEDACKVQCQDGNWNASEYMRGMANGLLLAQAILRGEEPEYLDQPKGEPAKTIITLTVGQLSARYELPSSLGLPEILSALKES